MLFVQFSYGQVSDSDSYFDTLEEKLEPILQLQLDEVADSTEREAVCMVASIIGVRQFVQHRYQDAIRTLEFAIKYSKRQDNTVKMQNYTFLIHSLCLTHNRDALIKLQELMQIFQDLQENTVRGDFPMEYADVMRMGMNDILLPLTSLISHTFPDNETLGYCFNLMMYLKQFSFYQLGNRFGTDIRHQLYQDYRTLISAKLQKDEVCIEFVPYMVIEEQKIKETNYVAYVLDSSGNLNFVEVCNKNEMEALYEYNDSSWLLYDKQSSQLSTIVWKKLEPYVTKKKRIYLAPCGILNRVNFLLFDSRIYELTSTRELLKSYIVNPHSDAVIIGDVNYNQSDTSQIRGEQDWGKLKGTKLEVDSIANILSPYYNITKLTQDNCSEAAIKQICMTSPKILHFATHAFCYTDSVRREQNDFFNFPYDYFPEKLEMTYTGIVLSEGNIGFKRSGNRSLNNDGILLSDEIYKLSLDGTALVVLSACNSANGIFDDIEGTVGLLRAFKLAGVKTVIASLFQIDDNAACEFMSEFYRRMVEEEDMHSSFVGAIKTMKAKYPDNPKFWAMFKLIDYKE